MINSFACPVKLNIAVNENFTCYANRAILENFCVLNFYVNHLNWPSDSLSDMFDGVIVFIESYRGYLAQAVACNKMGIRKFLH